MLDPEIHRPGVGIIFAKSCLAELPGSSSLYPPNPHCTVRTEMNLAQLVTDYGWLPHWPSAARWRANGPGHGWLRGAPRAAVVANGFAVAAIFSFAGDQMWFQVGRHYGQRLIERFTLLRERLPWLQVCGRAPRGAGIGHSFHGRPAHCRTNPDGLRTGTARRFLWLNLRSAPCSGHRLASAGYFSGRSWKRSAQDQNGRGMGLRRTCPARPVHPLVAIRPEGNDMSHSKSGHRHLPGLRPDLPGPRAGGCPHRPATISPPRSAANIRRE